MRIAAAQNLDSARRTDDEPARSSPAVTDEPARFQPVSGLIHSDVRRLAVSDDPLGGTTVSGRLADRLARPRAGSPLPDDVTASFGAQLGTDLSDVRVHADGEADDLARSVASTAFTVGSDIYFTRGNYSTTSESGRHLLAHELTHVMQNRQAPSSGVASAPTIGRADDPAERHADRVAGNVMQALRRRTSLETNSAATVVEQYRTAPTQTLRRLHRSVPARPVVRRMTIAAAELAKVEEKSVWVRNKDDRWVPGRIRQLRPYDMAGLPEQIAVVELADSTTVTARVVDVHDAPPPGAGLDDGPNLFGTGPDDKANPLQLALVPTGGDLDGGSPTELTPEVQHYFDLLSAIPKPQLDHEARLLLRDVHTDKGVGDLETFKAIAAALDLVRNPTPIQGEQKLLTVGEAEPLVVHTPHLEPPKLDAPQPERSTFFGPAAPSLPINGTPQLRPQTPRQPVATPALDPNRRLQSPEFAPNEIQLLNQLHQVKNSADLARLTTTGRSASDLLTIAGLAAVTTLDGLVSLAMLGRSAADIVAIGGLRESGDLSASDIACLARIDRSIQELRALAAIGLVTTAEELVLLATSGRSTRRLTTFAQFPQVNSLAELLDIAGWPEKDKDISRLAGISTATEFTHLQQLKTLHARFTLDRIVAIGKLRQVSSVAEIAKLAVLGRSAGELTQLSQLNLVTDVSGLVELTGAVKENRTAADVVTVATSAASTLRQPSITDIVQLCALPKTTVQIDELSTAAGVADAAQLIALADSTGSKEKAGDTWYTLDKRWNTLKAAWQEGWALTTLFNNMDAATTSAVQIPQAVNDPADQLQAYAMAFARMKADLDLIESMAPAVAEGAKALADAETRLADLTKLLTVFNTHIIPYCQGKPSALGAVNKQRSAILNAHKTLHAEGEQILADQKSYAELAALTAGAVDQAVTAQRKHTEAVGAVPTADTIEGPLVFREGKILFQQLQDDPEPGKSSYKAIEAAESPAETRPMWDFELADNPVGDLKGIFIRSQTTVRAAKKVENYERPRSTEPNPTMIIEPDAVDVRSDPSDQGLSTESFRDVPTRMLDRIGRLLIISMKKQAKYKTPHISLTMVGHQVLIAGNMAANTDQVADATKTLQELRKAAPDTASGRKITALLNGDYQHDHRLEARRAAKVPDGEPDPDHITEVITRLENIRQAILNGDLVWRPTPVEPPVEPPVKPAVKPPVKPAAEKPRTARVKETPEAAKLRKEAQIRETAERREAKAREKAERQEAEIRERAERREHGRRTNTAMSPGVIHGEMELLNDVKRQMTRKPAVAGPLQDWPFGGVKRDCLMCHRAFAIFNKHVAKPLGYRVITAGTHSKEYPRWQAPTWLLDVDDWAEKMTMPRLAEGWEFIGAVLEGPAESKLDIAVEQDEGYESDSDQED